MSRSRWFQHGAALAVILSAALGLRLAGIATQALWADELFSWKLASLPVTELLERATEQTAVHPPLYFLLLHFWMQLVGDSEVCLRLLAVVLSLCEIAGVYTLAAMVSSSPNSSEAKAFPWAASVAALLVACNPPQIHWAQQVRGYTLALALLTWSGVVLLATLRQRWPVPYHGWLVYGLLCALAVLTHYLAATVLLAQYLFAGVYLLYCCWKERREPRAATHAAASRQLLGLGLALASMLIVLAPYLETAWQHIELACYSEYTTLVGWRRFHSIRDALVGNGIMAIDTASNWDYLYALVLAGVLLWLVTDGRFESWLVFCCAVIPWVILNIVSLFSWRDAFWSRYLSFPQVWWLLATGLVLGRWRWPYRTPAVAALLLYFLSGVYHWYGRFLPAPSRSVPQAGIAYLREHYDPSEPLVVTGYRCYYPLAYQTRGWARPRLLLPAGMDREFVRGGMTHLADDEVLDEALLPYLQAPGVWLILCRLYSGCEPNLDTFPAHWELISSHGASLENPHGSDMYILHYRIHARPGRPPDPFAKYKSANKDGSKSNRQP